MTIFKYVGGGVTSNGGLQTEINYKHVEAASMFECSTTTMWRKNIHVDRNKGGSV